MGKYFVIIGLIYTPFLVGKPPVKKNKIILGINLNCGLGMPASDYRPLKSPQNINTLGGSIYFKDKYASVGVETNYNFRRVKQVLGWSDYYQQQKNRLTGVFLEFYLYKHNPLSVGFRMRWLSCTSNIVEYSRDAELNTFLSPKRVISYGCFLPGLSMRYMISKYLNAEAFYYLVYGSKAHINAPNQHFGIKLNGMLEW